MLVKMSQNISHMSTFGILQQDIVTLGSSQSNVVGHTRIAVIFLWQAIHHAYQLDRQLRKFLLYIREIVFGIAKIFHDDDFIISHTALADGLQRVSQLRDTIEVGHHDADHRYLASSCWNTASSLRRPLAVQIALAASMCQST